MIYEAVLDVFASASAKKLWIDISYASACRYHLKISFCKFLTKSVPHLSYLIKFINIIPVFFRPLSLLSPLSQPPHLRQPTLSNKFRQIPSRPLPRFCQSFKYQEEKQRCLRSIIKPVRI